MQIDVTHYVARTRMNATNGIVLAHRLLETAEAEAAEAGGEPDPVRLGLLAQVTKKVGHVKVALRDKVLQKPEKLRPVVQPVVNVMIAMHAGLEAIARLPGDTVKRAKRAQQVLAIAFPEGTAFVGGDAEAIWVGASGFLAIVDERELGGEIADLIGAEFLEVARGSVDALGTVLGVKKGARRLPARAAVREALISLGYAIARYGRYLVAELDEDEPESVARFLRLVAPLDAHRASYGGRADAEDEDLDGELEPETPSEPSAPVAPPVTPPNPWPNGGGPFTDEDPV